MREFRYVLDEYGLTSDELRSRISTAWADPAVRGEGVPASWSADESVALRRASLASPTTTFDGTLTSIVDARNTALAAVADPGPCERHVDYVATLLVLTDADVPAIRGDAIAEAWECDRCVAVAPTLLGLAAVARAADQVGKSRGDRATIIALSSADKALEVWARRTWNLPAEVIGDPVGEAVRWEAAGFTPDSAMPWTTVGFAFAEDATALSERGLAPGEETLDFRDQQQTWPLPDAAAAAKAVQRKFAGQGRWGDPTGWEPGKPVPYRLLCALRQALHETGWPRRSETPTSRAAAEVAPGVLAQSGYSHAAAS